MAIKGAYMQGENKWIRPAEAPKQPQAPCTWSHTCAKSPMRCARPHLMV